MQFANTVTSLLTIALSDTSAIQHHVEIETNPLKGINPKSGKDGELILRITHISGTDSVEILYDANTGMIGCTTITIPGYVGYSGY